MELSEERAKSYLANVNIRTVYITQDRRVFCFIYRIEPEQSVVRFAGTVWKHIAESSPIRKKDAHKTTLERFNKKPYTFALTKPSELGEICEPLSLNFYQFRRLENLLPKIWYYFNNLPSHMKFAKHNDSNLDIPYLSSIFDPELTKQERLRDSRDAKRRLLKEALKNSGVSINEVLSVLNEHQDLISENKRLRALLK